jgi:hypothetical protein
VALLGVLTRYLQLETQPTWPPLRLISVMILLCAPVTLCLHLAMHWQAWWQGRAQQLEQHDSGNSAGSQGSVDVEKPASKAAHKQAPPCSTPPAGSWRCRHPRLHCAISLAQSVVLVFMIIAPRLVDASVSKQRRSVALLPPPLQLLLPPLYLQVPPPLLPLLLPDAAVS